MKYKETFVVEIEEVIRHGNGIIDYLKNKSSYRIGEVICSHIGFKEVKGEYPNLQQFEIEICAFAWNDWIEFKRKFSEMFFHGLLTLGRPELKKLFDDLESKGLENIPDNIKNEIIENSQK